jgi:hypothetical protein
MARYTSLIRLAEPWDIMTSWWVIGTLLVLLVVETVADTIPAVDSVNDIIQSFFRPAAGAVLFAAGSGVVGEVHPVLAMVAGLLVAGSVHAVKATARPVVTASTGGAANWFVSILEDVLSFFTAVLAIIVPVLGIILITIGLIILFLFWRGRRRPKQYVR